MRILSVTPYCISNYGAMLQAWALRSVLEKMGHSVQYLQYPYFWVRHFGWSRLLRSRSLAALRSKLATNRQMEIVRQEVGGWNETRPYRNPAALAADPPLADCYLVGSDQVFHLHFLKDAFKSRHALLNFGADSVRRVAYAASFGCPDRLFYQIQNQLLHAIFDTLNSRYIFVGKVRKFFCIDVA